MKRTFVKKMKKSEENCVHTVTLPTAITIPIPIEITNTTTTSHNHHNHMLRHEQQAIAMALAAALHQSAGPKEKKEELQQNAALRRQNTGARASSATVQVGCGVGRA